MIAVMWSTVSAGLPQYAQSGLFDRMIARLRLYSVLACSLPIASASQATCSLFVDIQVARRARAFYVGLLSVCYVAS